MGWQNPGGDSEIRGGRAGGDFVIRGKHAQPALM